MEVRTTGSNNFARLSNDLIAYKASAESDLEVNGSVTSHPRMHLSGYEGHNNNNSRTSTMKYDRRYTSAGTGIGDPVRLWPQQGHETRNDAAAASISSASAYSATSRRGHNTNRPPTTSEVRTSCLVKSTSGFGFTMADAPTGHMVKLMAEPLGTGQLQPGDIIVMIDGVDVRRKSHANTVTMLKSYLPGSTVIISYVRPNVDRNPHLRPHSAIPRSSMYSPMNGGGDGIGHGVGVNGERNTIDHRSINHRVLTTHPEVIPSDLNGGTASSSSAAASFHHPRTVSFDNSTTTGDAAMKTGHVNGEETMGRLRESRRLKDILRRRPPSSRRSTPDRKTQRRTQDLMSTTSSVSNLNFSGTPDFIPASLYRPTLSASEDAVEPIQALQAGSWPIVQSAGNAFDPPAQRPRPETTHALSTFGPSIASARGEELSDVSSRVRRRSLVSESNSHRIIKTTKSIDNEDRLQQMSITNHQQLPLYQNESMRRSERGRRDSGRRKHSGDVNTNGESSVIESVDPSSLVFNADIHRGSRGFGFSIRGGKEFNGMPLLVLDIAEGGPAYMDGRMKNGDQILSINGFSTSDMTHERAIDLIQNACSPISLVMKRSSSNAKRQLRPSKAEDTMQTKHS